MQEINNKFLPIIKPINEIIGGICISLDSFVILIYFLTLIYKNNTVGFELVFYLSVCNLVNDIRYLMFSDDIQTEIINYDDSSKNSSKLFF